MVDYSPVLVDKHEIRNFFTPPISYDDISEAQLLGRIQAKEEYVSAVYFDGGNPTGTSTKIAITLLIAADMARDPRISKKYHTLDREKFLQDYEYRLAGLNTRISQANSSKWENEAKQILNTQAASTASLAIWNVRKTNE